MRKYFIAVALFAATCCFVVGCGDGKKCCDPKPQQMNAPKPDCCNPQKECCPTGPCCPPKRTCGNEKVDTSQGVVPIPPSKD